MTLPASARIAAISYAIDGTTCERIRLRHADGVDDGKGPRLAEVGKLVDDAKRKWLPPHLPRVSGHAAKKSHRGRLMCAA
jgi:hypothetical protein